VLRQVRLLSQAQSARHPVQSLTVPSLARPQAPHHVGRVVRRDLGADRRDGRRAAGPRRVEWFEAGLSAPALPLELAPAPQEQPPPEAGLPDVLPQVARVQRRAGLSGRQAEVAACRAASPQGVGAEVPRDARRAAAVAQGVPQAAGVVPVGQQEAAGARGARRAAPVVRPVAAAVRVLLRAGAEARALPQEAAAHRGAPAAFSARLDLRQAAPVRQ
jgi:hypothetical protein